MGFLSDIANSGAARVGAFAMGISSLIAPTIEMLKPPAVHAQERVDYNRLIERVKKGDTFPVNVHNDDGSTSQITGYRLSGYNPELRSLVEFIFYTIGSGVLETMIVDSAFAPRNLASEHISSTHSLVVQEGTSGPIDGVPEAVLIRTSNCLGACGVNNKPTEQNPAYMRVETDFFHPYLNDKRTKLGVDREYSLALTKTIIPQPAR